MRASPRSAGETAITRSACDSAHRNIFPVHRKGGYFTRSLPWQVITHLNRVRRASITAAKPSGYAKWLSMICGRQTSSPKRRRAPIAIVSPCSQVAILGSTRYRGRKSCWPSGVSDCLSSRASLLYRPSHGRGGKYGVGAAIRTSATSARALARCSMKVPSVGWTELGYIWLSSSIRGRVTG